MLTVGGKGSSQKRTPAEADHIDPRKPVREGLPGRPPSLDFQSVITIIPIYSNARLLGRFSYLSAWLGYQHGKGRRSEHAVLRNASLRSAPRAKEAVQSAIHGAVSASGVAGCCLGLVQLGRASYQVREPGAPSPTVGATEPSVALSHTGGAAATPS